tara:strand:- start:794 stop:1384 length:591 start_codon:yes stop_codon:yes gene_type:complete
MSSYNPPVDNLPIFSTIVFKESNNNSLTLGQADKRYLRFPFAQGTENLQSINVSGSTTLNGGLTIGGAKNITLGTGTIAPTVGQLGYIYNVLVNPSALVGGSIGSIILPAGTYMGTIAILLGGTFVANNFISVDNIGYVDRNQIITSTGTVPVGGGYTGMCNGAFIFNITSSTNVVFTNGVANSQTYVSKDVRIVK